MVVGLLTGGVLLAACSSSSTPATTTTAPPGGTLSSSNSAYLKADLTAPSGTLQAAGSTFVQPFFTKAFFTYTGLNQGLQVNYQGVGSGAGITDFQAGSVNFAASDVPMAASDLAKVPASDGPVIQLPDALGGVAVAYNLPGVTSHLKFDAATIAGIFQGTIKTWNASAIKTLNPSVTLPSNAIVPEVRADSSGTTYIFSDYVAKAAGTAWTLGTSKTISWPSVAVQTPKNSGVAASIQSTPYSIGYLELGYAIQNHFSYAAGQERGRALRGPRRYHGGRRCRPEDQRDVDQFLHCQRAGRHQLPDLRLQLGHPAAEADQWHDRRPGGQGPRQDHAHRRGPGPGGRPRLRAAAANIQNQDRPALLTVTGPTGTALLTK